MTVHSVPQRRIRMGMETSREGVYFARARKDVLLETRAVRLQNPTDYPRRCSGCIALHDLYHLPLPTL
jgi:hypothetical protein